jgi:hypothetical protein
MTSLLVDTGAAVTLLRKDTWDRVSRCSLLELQPSSGLRLVRTDSSPLQSNGTARVSLAFEGNTIPMDVVVVCPLTAKGIRGLDLDVMLV